MNPESEYTARSPAGGWDVITERKEAHAVIYLDIQGFTRCLDDLDAAENSEELLKAFFEAWGKFRNLLIRPREFSFKFNYYLANRIGDAFVILSFVDRVESWFVFVTHYVAMIFDEFRAEVSAFYPELTTHLKTTIYTTPSGVVPYFQTAPIPPEVMGQQTIARRDFIASGINTCARIDALDEADDFTFLCNGPVFDRMARAYAESSIPDEFEDLGRRTLRGLKAPERVYGFRRLRGG